jgi:hypothetical protein
MRRIDWPLRVIGDRRLYDGSVSIRYPGEAVAIRVAPFATGTIRGGGVDRGPDNA